MFQKIPGGLEVKSVNNDDRLDETATLSPFYNKQRDTTRTAIVGQSGCGKTNLLYNLLQSNLLGPWTKCHIYAKSLEDPIYEKLEDMVSNASTAFGDSLDEVISFQSDPECITSVDNLDKRYRHVVVFDDFVTSPSLQPLIEDYFIRGRKKNVTCFYLSQGYYPIPKLVRAQCNVFVLFGQNDQSEITRLWKCHPCGIKTAAEFRDIYNEATKEPYSFLLLDPQCHNPELRIRKNLDEILYK